MKNKKLAGSLLLLLTAFIWGCAFVSQRIGMSYVQPFTFNSIRTFIGGLFLIPFIPVFCRNKPMLPPKRQERKVLLAGGLVCGLLLCLATNLQQVGLQYTTAGKGGFITSLYIVLVPCLGLFIGQRIGKALWAAVVLAVAGLYLLCIPADGGFGEVNKGDLIILLCSLLLPLIPALRTAFFGADQTGAEEKPKALAVRSFIRREEDEPGDIRPYVPGDPLRRIHWKLSVKKDELLI